MRKKLGLPFIPVLVILLSSTVLMTGCFNLFSIFHSFGSGNYAGLLDEGDAAYQNNDFQTAMLKYKAASSANSASGRARVGYINSLAKVRFVDFLYLAQKFTSSNFNAVELLNEPMVINDLIGQTGLFEETITYLQPIVDGKCDSTVKPNDLNLNIQLTLAYLIRGMVKLADSNGDGIIANTNDLLILKAGNQIEFNTKIINFNQIASNMSAASTNAQSGIGSGSDPLSVFKSIGNINSLTNLMLGTNTDYGHYLRAIHDSIEIGLNLLKIASTSFGYISNAFSRINAIASQYAGNAIVGGLSKKISDIYTQVSAFNVNIENYANGFNNFHRSITGVLAFFPPPVSNFTNSSFASHVLARRASPGTNMMSPMFISPGNHLSITNATSIYSNMIKSVSLYSNSDLTILLQQWLGGW